jgi:hypothetical protein
MQNRLRENGIRNREAAIAELLEVRDQAPMEVINEVCESLPNRIEALRE